MRSLSRGKACWRLLTGRAWSATCARAARRRRWATARLLAPSAGSGTGRQAAGSRAGAGTGFRPRAQRARLGSGTGRAAFPRAHRARGARSTPTVHAADLTSLVGHNLPADHRGTFTKLTSATFMQVKSVYPGIASSPTLRRSWARTRSSAPPLLRGSRPRDSPAWSQREAGDPVYGRPLAQSFYRVSCSAIR
jgi:hypothetical protein